MSAWVSHLSREIVHERVVGLDMHKEELRRNGKLDSYVVQNRNTDPQLPFGEGESNGVGICVSIDYLTRPVEVPQGVRRVLEAGSPITITFSDRYFPTKAVAV